MLVTLLGEAMGLVLPAIKLGLDISDVVSRSIALAKSPTPTTADELSEFSAAIESTRRRLDDLTAELEKDPT
jgi:hypothetical protein